MTPSASLDLQARQAAAAATPAALAGLAEPAGPAASWPGSLVERALSLLAADYRRPTGPIAIAAVLALAAVLARGSESGPFGYQLAVALGVLATAPIAVIRRLPAAAIAAVLTASAVFVIFGRLSWSAAAVAGWLIALAACPVMLPRRQAVLAGVLTEGAVLLGPFGNVTPWDATAAEALAVIAAWGAGEMLRARRQAAVTQAAAAQQLRDLSERDAVARERASIARELHDVVAHHVSMIAVRAATAPYAVSGLPGGGQAAFAEIAEEARAALTELRVVLGVLRAPGGASETAPQPRLADLGDLLERMSGAGPDVAMTVTGEVRLLPGSIELCGYRIVQEALTNARRHAPGSRVGVQLCYGEATLSIRVGNDRGTGAALAADPARPAVPAAGYGLTGLRERVEMLRGRFQAGPDGQGGFLVAALLPIEPGAAPDREPDAAAGTTPAGAAA